MFYECDSLYLFPNKIQLNYYNFIDANNISSESKESPSLIEEQGNNISNEEEDEDKFYDDFYGENVIPNTSSKILASNTDDMANKDNKNNSLPLIKTSNVINMNDMFGQCHSLISLPDISKWDTSKVTRMDSMFFKCYSLIALPDISKWNISNVINNSKMFYGCVSLISLPDISKWTTSKITDMKGLF